MLGALRERWLTPSSPNWHPLSKQIFTEVDEVDCIQALPLLGVDSLDDIGDGDDIELSPTYIAGSVQKFSRWIGRGLPSLLLKWSLPDCLLCFP